MTNAGNLNPNSSQRSPSGIVLILLIVSTQTISAASDDTTLAETSFNNLQVLTAEHLVKAVLGRNSNITARQAAWEVMQARIDQASALDDPILSYQLAPQTIARSNVDLGHKLSISQHLPWPGKRKLRAEVARFEANATREDTTQTRLALTQASQFAFSDWYYLYAALRINKINQSLLQEFQEIAEVKYSSGRTSKQDVLRAEVEVALLEHRSIVLQRQRREVLSTINTLLQRQPDLTIPPPGMISTDAKPPAVAELRELTLDRNPGLRALRQRVLASESRLELSDRNFLPDINLSAGYNSLWNQDQKRLTLGASINIPLRNKRHAASDESRAHTLRLVAEQKSAVAKVLDVLQRAYEQLDENQHVLHLFRERLLPLAKENLAAAQSDYQSGSGSFLDLISAEKNLMQTQLQLERARADYQRRWANLEHASGGSLVSANHNLKGTP